MAAAADPEALPESDAGNYNSREEGSCCCRRSRFPWQKADVLRFDRQDLAAIVIVKSQNFGVLITHFLPDVRVGQFLVFLPVQFRETGRIFRALRLSPLLFWSC